jgi:hypothetical protein
MPDPGPTQRRKAQLGLVEGAGDPLGLGKDHLAHVLRIERLRQRGRADEIAEQHGQLPPLGV